MLSSNNIPVIEQQPPRIGHCKNKIIFSNCRLVGALCRPDVHIFFCSLHALHVQFLACNHVTRRPCWWCIGGQYNRIFSRRIYMKIGFSSQRREMLLLTLSRAHCVILHLMLAFHSNNTIFFQNSSYVSSVIFVALYVRMFVARANKVEGTMS